MLTLGHVGARQWIIMGMERVLVRVVLVAFLARGKATRG